MTRSARTTPMPDLRTKLRLEPLEVRETPAARLFDNLGPVIPQFNATTGWPQPGGRGSPVTVTYSYSNLLDGGLGGGLPPGVIRASIEEALGRWAAVAPLKFVEVADSGPPPSDNFYPAAGTPMIRFGHHGFDGVYGVLAHARYPGTNGFDGDVHFDDGEIWTAAPDAVVPANSTDLVEVATHEIGHALGLAHEALPPQGRDAIMNPIYQGRYNGPGTSFLLPDDIEGIRAIYGAGVGSVTPIPGYFVSLDVSGTAGADDILVTDAGTPGQVRAVVNGVVTQTVPATRLRTVNVNAGDGNDRVRVEVGPSVRVTIDGGAGNDTLIGGAAAELFLGGAGNDEVHAMDGNDTMYGGSGDDILHAYAGNDLMVGEDGNDLLGGGLGNDTGLGGAGRDLVFGHEDNDLLDGGDGADDLLAGTGANILRGGAGLDVYHQADADDRIEDADGLWAGRTVTLGAVNAAGRYIRHRGFEAWVDPSDGTQLFSADSAFVLRRGLAGPDSVSFESVNFPGRFLRHRGFQFFLDAAENTALFQADASFIPRAGLADGSAVSFESVNFPGWFLRHQYFRVVLSPNDGSALLRQDATFRVGDQLPVTPPRPVKPAAPTNVASPNIWRNAADISWADRSNNETRFVIYMSTDGRTYHEAGRVGANVTRFRATGLKANTRYWFKVAAVNEAGAVESGPISIRTKA